MLDSVIGLLSVLNAGQHRFPFDHELFEIVSSELDIQKMLHIANRSVGLAHPEVLVDHVEQLPARHTTHF